MRTSRRPNRLRGFGMIDALVGLFLTAATVALLFSGYSTLMALGQRQETKAEGLVKSSDAEPYGPWL